MARGKTIYLLDNKGRKIFKTEEKEEAFRYIWSNVFRITDEENQLFCRENERRINRYLQLQNFEINHFEFAELDRLNPDCDLTKPETIHEIQQIIKDFKNNKALRESKINKVLLLNLPILAIKRYRDIINLTISMRYFPIIFKNGLIILILKPGKDPRNPINYRPITLLEIPGKISEKIINTRVHKFCESNNIFHEHQYGFRAGRGTDIAITKVYETVALNQEYKDHCNIICRNVSKAFDKVWTSGLKYKIITIEDLPSIIKKIMCSCLEERTAQIEIENIIGPKIKLESGVPQRGILSLTMYILYKRDIPLPGHDCMDVLFADDVTQVIVNYNDDRRQWALTS